MMTFRWFARPAIELGFSRQPWLLAALLVAAAPALHMAATWDLDGRLSSQAFAVRHYSYIIVLIEIGVIWLAARKAPLIQFTFSALPKIVAAMLGIWICFAVAGLLSSSSDLANATFVLARYIIHGFFLIALVHLVGATKNFKTQTWLILLSFGAVAYVLLLLIFCLLVPDPQGFPWMIRIPSATNIRQIGNNVGMLAIAPVALLLATGRASLMRYGAAFMIAFSFATWTGSRATILGLFVGIAVALLLVKNYTSVRNILAAMLSALAAMGLSLMAPVPHSAIGILRLIKSSGEQADASSGRWEMWSQAWQHILQSPWIGYGAGRYAKQMEVVYGTQWNHPHNFILQYIYDWGFFGGTAALILLAIFGITILRARDTEPIARFTAIAAFVAIISMSLIDGPLFHPLPIMVALALIAPALAKASKS